MAMKRTFWIELPNVCFLTIDQKKRLYPPFTNYGKRDITTCSNILKRRFDVLF